MTVTPRKDLVTAMLSSSAFAEFMRTYNVAITVVLGIVTLTVLVLLFLNIAKLSSSADNDYKRREAISGILVCLICTAFIGGIDTVYGILLSLIFNMDSM